MCAESKKFEIEAIGTICRKDKKVWIEIAEPFRPALKGLNTFSHVIVFWWADRFDKSEHRQVLVTPLPYAEDRETGVFANRSPERPNLIMNTVCKILDVDETLGRVEVRNIDAFSDTPVIDLKAYFPVTDRVKDAHISEYLQGWPQWLPEEGISLMEYEAEAE